MNIDLATAAPLAGLAGGALIGAAAALLLLFNGRVAGISGIAGALLDGHAGDRGWRIAFLLGLVTAPLGYALLHALPVLQIDAAWPRLVAAGTLVGLGTVYGSGCTSGHGVCGLARGSLRSLVATATFVATGMATVFVTHHGLAR